MTASSLDPDATETTYRGNQPKGTVELEEWLTKAVPSEAVDPDVPVVDAHHHLFGQAGDRLYYRLDDLRRDADSGHAVLGTVYIEAYDSGWRTSGPEAFRPVGEVEWIAGLTKHPISTGRGPCEVAAGIVCHADLTLGDEVAEVLREHRSVSDGRLRGLRQRSAYVAGEVARHTPNQRRAHLLVDPDFRRGFRHLAKFDLSFDAWIYHTQIDELLDLTDRFPGTTVVVNHMAGPIGVAEFRARHEEVLQVWRNGMRALAARPNVVMKIGGMGMPLYGHGFEFARSPAGGDQLARAWRPSVETCVEAFGADRCMFESNSPVDKQSCRYVDLWNAFKLVTRGWSDDERSSLFYRTACRTYRLPELERRGDELMGRPRHT